MPAGEPDLPEDPAEYRPKPLLGPAFWAFIAFGILCVLGGAGVVLMGPKLGGQAPAPNSQSAPPSAAK